MGSHENARSALECGSSSYRLRSRKLASGRAPASELAQKERRQLRGRTPRRLRHGDLHNGGHRDSQRKAVFPSVLFVLLFTRFFSARDDFFLLIARHLSLVTRGTVWLRLAAQCPLW